MSSYYSTAQAGAQTNYRHAHGDDAGADSRE